MTWPTLPLSHLAALRSPVVRLTAWYVLIIMAISITFSAVIYRQTTAQFRAGFLPHDRFFRVMEPRFQPLFEDPVARLLEERYDAVTSRLRVGLVVINLAILGGASLASYFLAKRTLRPIEEALDEQRRFTADASHELRTPLAAMKAEIDVALRADDPKDQRRVLASTVEEVDKLERLSSSLLQLARHEDERRRPMVGSVQLKAVVDEASRRVATLAKQKQMIIESDAVDGTLIGDQASLVELFVILLDNAMKYSPAKSTVQLRATWTKKQLTVTVVDHGVGIPAGALPHVFQRFYRADVARAKAGTNGFGLGLAIAKQIVDRHRGTITIDSEVGQGTTVTVTLPLDRSSFSAPFQAGPVD